MFTFELTTCNFPWWSPTSIMLLTNVYPAAPLFLPLQLPVLLQSSSSLFSKFDNIQLRAIPHCFQSQPHLYKWFAGKRKSLSHDNNNYYKLLFSSSVKTLIKCSQTQNWHKKSCLHLKMCASSEAIVSTICTLAIHELQDYILQSRLSEISIGQRNVKRSDQWTLHKDSLTQDYNMSK